MLITRRSLMAAGGVLAAGAATGLSSRRVFAQDKQLNVISNAVSRTTSYEGPGGNIVEPWEQQTGWTVEWTPFGDSNDLYERLMREASLSETEIDVGWLLNTRATARNMSLFEPLNDYLAANPIENFEDIFPNMVDAMTVDGKIYGIPFRQAVGGLHYNEQFLEERGLTQPPQTAEDILEYAKQLSYTRDDGSKVYGFLLVGYPSIVGYSRGWNGDYITSDFKVLANQPPMVRTISAMREMYEAGAFPEAFVTTLKEDQNTWMQQGRVAMCITPMGRNTLFNDPEKSLYSGRIKTIAIPSSPDIKAQFPVAPANVEMWNMVIPRASKRKEQAWDFIRNLISPQNVLKAALNGNGPIRASTYQDAAYNVSYAQEEGKALAVSRPPMPAFDNSARADDMFVEAFQSALLGMQEPQEAMDNLTAEVTQLMPS